MQTSSHSSVPLCIDLDGTFILSDLAQECVGSLLRNRPLQILKLPFWILKGRVHTKRKLLEYAELDVRHIPINESLYAWMKEEKKSGRQLYLVTASLQAAADKIGAIYPEFSEVIGTRDSINLRGSAKAAYLVERFGEKQFDYAGNEPLDLNVWMHANSAIVTSSSKRWIDDIKTKVPVSKIFLKPRPSLKNWFKLLRIHQWSKNALLFFPVLAAHEINDLGKLRSAGFGFLAMGTVASATYILNDFLDLNSDRTHATKRLRPLATGIIPISSGLKALLGLFAVGFFLATFVSHAFVWLLFGYVFCSLLYSIRLKRLLGVDVLMLAALYTFRIFAGSVATETPMTTWFLSFSMFFFLSLALLKRFIEFRGSAEVKSGRAYRAEHSDVMFLMGGLSGIISVSIFVFYITLAETTFLYREPARLWWICPLLTFWIVRVWLLARSRKVDEDPVLFALKDRTSYIVLAAVLSIMFWAI